MQLAEKKKLQKIKFEQLDYGKFEKLRIKFQSDDFNPEKTENLDLSQQNSDILPNRKCLEHLVNLTYLSLSDNMINRFDATIITKTLPHLKRLDLSNNKIDYIDDIVELGTLSNMDILDFSNNPVCEYLSWINILKKISYPQKYKKYDPVKILTAQYHKVPNPKLSQKEEKELKEDLESVQKDLEEIRLEQKSGFKNQVSKYNHKNTLAKFSMEKTCPVPRKSRFKNLEYLNGTYITLFDIMRASGEQDLKNILEEVPNTKFVPEQKPRQGTEAIYDIVIKNGRIQRQNQEDHKKYLTSYKKKIKRIVDENTTNFTKNSNQPVKKLKGGDEFDAENQNFFSQLDLKDQQKIKEKIDPKKYSADIWEHPSDKQFQEANFNISMKDYNQMVIDYKREKREKVLKKEEKIKKRRLKRKDMINQKLNAMGIHEPKGGDNYSSGESDFEVKKIFRKPKELKPKLNLDNENSCYYGTSESEQDEKIINFSDESFNNFNDKNDGIDIGEISEDDKDKEFKEISKNDHLKFKEQEKIKKEKQNNNVMELMKQKEESIKKEQLEKQQKLQKKKSQMAAQSQKLKQQQQQQQKEQQIDNQIQQQEQEKQKKKLQEQQELEQQQLLEKQKEEQNKAETPTKNLSKISGTLQTQQSIGKTAVTGGSQFPNQFNQFTTAQTEQTFDANYGQQTMKTEPNAVNNNNTQDNNQNLLTEKAEYQMLEVTNFELNTQFTRPVSVLQARQQKQYEQKQVSQIKNKIFAPHPAVKSSSIDKLSKTAKQPYLKSNYGQRPGAHLKSESAIDVKQKPKTSEQSSRFGNSSNQTFAKINKPKKKNQSNKTEFYEAPKVIVKGDINAHNFAKSDVPLVDLIPTEEQGFDKKWRDQIVYDTNCQGHKEMKRFKELIDAAEDTRQVAIDINNKLEMPGLKRKQQQVVEQKIIPYNQVIEYLKTDERNTIEKNLEPFNKIVKETMKKHGHFPEPKPQNKNEVEINQNKLNQIRQQKEYKISKDKGPKLNEKLTLEYLNKNSNQISFQEKQKLYEQLYVNINNDADQEVNIDLLQQQEQQKRIDKALDKVDKKIKYSEDENNKITNHVLREVIYKANNYDPQTEPKLTEKEILEQIERDDIPFSQKAKLYEYLEVIEEIRMKKNKTSQGMLKKLEEKEIERAQSNAHLAYHYQKLKKYMDPAYIAQHLKELGIQQKDPGKIQYKEIKDDQGDGLGVVDNRLEMGLNKFKQKQFNFVSGDQNLDMLNKLQGKKNQKDQDLPDYEVFHKRLETLKQKKMEKRPEVKFRPISQDMQEDYQKYLQKIKPYKPPINSMASLEELTQANLRRLEENYMETQAVTVEEQMMKHAKELKDKVKQREMLKSNIDKYIKENKTKQQEFNNWAWQELEHAEDKEYCFLQYVKAIREGKVKNQLY